MLVLFISADSGYSGSCLEEYHENCPGEKRGPGELDDLQGSAPPSSRAIHSDEQEMGQRWLETCMDEQLLTKLKRKRERYRKWKQSWMPCQSMSDHAGMDEIRKAKVHLDFNLMRDVKDNDKNF
ncbi:hypothetical protein BTVI_110327 [Pitangus sulphuratus]|nr:hypothetical protein BTVI_110327 [Pitangus sulphuratus]